MKQFYECTMKHNLLASKSTKDWIEFDINTLIRDEAIMMGECDDSDFYIVNKKGNKL